MFLRKFLLLGIVIIFAFAMAGCNRGGGIAVPPSKKLENGGNLLYGSLQEPNTLNPLLSDLIASQEVGNLIFSGLVLQTDKGEWVSDLAADVPSRENGEVSPDGRSITYKLRPGVTWHDGVPFSSADVKFTWQLIMNSKVDVVSREGYNKISSIDTPDANTVVVHYSEYYPPFLSLFRTILPKHILEKEADINKAAFNRAPIGTGPFKIKEWRMAEELIFEANPAYFRGKPLLNTITYKIINESSLILTQLKTGEVDVVSNIPFNLYEQVKAINGVKTLITPNMVWEHLDFNLDNILFQDVKVRQAIMYGIDRQAIVNSILKGVASPAAGDQSPLSWAYNPALGVPARDVQTARNLLTEAGWQIGPDGIFAKDGRKLAFSLVIPSGNRIREIIAQTIVQQLKEAGIGVEVKLVAPEVFFNQVLKNRQFEMAMYAWVGSADPDNINLWHSKNIPGAGNGYQGQNYPGWRNTTVDKLVEQGIRSFNIEERKQIYFSVQQQIIDDVPVIPLYFRANIDVVRDGVVNYKPNPSISSNTWNAWEWGLMTRK